MRKTMSLLIALAVLPGCAYVGSRTAKSTDPKTGIVTEVTRMRAYTLWDSQSSLTKFRNTTGQVGNGSNVWSYPSGTSLGSLAEQSTSNTNLANVLSAIAEGAVKGLK